MPPKLKFAEGEKVLCFHGPLIYEAKCLKSTVTKDKQVKYFVHYAGWSKSWDEWVPESRVLKYNDVNVAKQKEVQKNHSAPVKGKKTKAKSKTDLNTSKSSSLDSRASTPVLDTQSERKSIKTKPSTPSSSTSDVLQTPDASKKKKARTDFPEPEGVFESKIEVNINIPDDLKVLLVDDWDTIKRQKKLWTLPASMTVDNILDDYLSYMKMNRVSLNNPESAIVEMIAGIRSHFNTVVNTQLLYRIERQQFMDLIDDDIQPSEVYGGIHLLRLFVRIGPNLSYTFMDDNHIQFLVDQMETFLKFMSKNSVKLFEAQMSYNPTSEYLKKVSMI